MIPSSPVANGSEADDDLSNPGAHHDVRRMRSRRSLHFRRRFRAQGEWGVEVTAGSIVLFRRMGVIYLGLAPMFFLGRAAGASDFRSAVCLVTGGASALLACLGLFEFLARRVSAGIFRSVAAEAVLAAGFFWVWWVGR
jgi:hypothetical protein